MIAAPRRLMVGGTVAILLGVTVSATILARANTQTQETPYTLRVAGVLSGFDERAHGCKITDVQLSDPDGRLQWYSVRATPAARHGGCSIWFMGHLAFPGPLKEFHVALGEDMLADFRLNDVTNSAMQPVRHSFMLQTTVDIAAVTEGRLFKHDYSFSIPIE